MTIDISKLCYIESHEYGGQIFLDPNTKDGSLLGYTHHAAWKDNFRDTANFKQYAYSLKGKYLCFIPAMTLDKVAASSANDGRYYLATCSIEFTGTPPTAPIEPVKPHTAEVYDDLPAGTPRPPLTPEIQAELDAYEQAESTFNNIDLPRYIRELNNYINTTPCICTVKDIVAWDGKQFNLIAFDENKKYDTQWDIIRTPNILNVADVLLLRMHKSGDKFDGRFLTLTSFPSDINCQVSLGLTKFINSPSQLWELVMAKG